jgi:CheY-like chemotaxis protein
MNDRTIKVLIIDDNEVDRYTFRRYLEQRSSDFEVHEAGDGKTGLDLALALKPDCVLLDLKLQEQSGYEVLHELVGSEPPPKMSVLMLSALGGDMLKRGAEMLHASGYLVKGGINAGDTRDAGEPVSLSFQLSFPTGSLRRTDERPVGFPPRARVGVEDARPTLRNAAALLGFLHAARFQAIPSAAEGCRFDRRASFEARA